MNTNTRRPAHVWIAVGLLLVLAFLSCVGGFLFNLSGAEDLNEYLVGGIFVALGAVYLVTAVRLPSGRPVWRVVALSVAAAHGLFNAVVKVGIEGETESLMFVGLTAVLILVLVLPRARTFFEGGQPVLTSTGRAS